MTESDPPLKEPAISFAETELVTILVGPDEHKVVVHEGSITRTSEFFKAAIKKRWTEGQTRIIKLPEETCMITFYYYLNFAYGQKLPSDEVRTVTEIGFPKQSYRTLAQLYVLGKRMLDESIQHAVIREILRLCSLKNKQGASWFPTGAVVGEIYDGTTAASPARRLMVDLHIAYGMQIWLEDDAHPTFLLDLSRAVLDNYDRPIPARIARGQKLTAKNYYI